MASSRAAETNASGPVEAEQLLRENIRLQAQLLAIERGLEQVRVEAEAAAKRNADALASRMALIEEALKTQRQHEVQAMQDTNRLTLTVAGALAAGGFLAMLLAGWAQFRAMNRITEVAAGINAALQPGRGFPGLTLGDGAQSGSGPDVVHQSNGRLLGALERLEKRILDLESPGPSNATEMDSPETPPALVAGPVVDGAGAEISGLLGKGQAFLNLNQPGEALECFEAILKTAPDHIEALLKRGAALERMKRDDEAIKSYDRVLALDGSVTTAYLYKGGVFNRLKRYAEALDCYEQALNAQQKKPGNVSSN